MKNIATLYCLIALAAIFSSVGCKKSSSAGGGGNTPTPAPTKGQAIIYLKQDCNVGNVTATINGVNKIIRNSSSYIPGCDADSSYAIFPLEAGTYTIHAAGQNMNWNSNITVTAGVCSGLQLTCDAVTPAIKGSAGTPRFNLVHTAGVDFDLHVTSPDGVEINSFNTSGTAGKMDLQSSCLGSDTNPGILGTLTSENIWYSTGAAQHGVYKFWVQYYTYCGSSATNGSYTLRVLDGFNTVKTYTGTLTPLATKSTVYTITY